MAVELWQRTYCRRLTVVQRELAVVGRRGAVVGRHCCQLDGVYLLWLVVSATNSRSKGLEFNIAYNSSVAMSPS